MAVQDIFSDDPAAERLASYFEELYEYLLAEGVPEECLPSPWHVLRRVTKAIDHEQLREWLDAYSSVEAELDDSEDEDDDVPVHEGEPPHERPKHKPPYLRALSAEPSEEDELDDTEDTASSDDVT